MPSIDLPPLARPTLLFIGVTTGGSFVNRLFPVWAEEMGLGDVELRGIDLPVDAAPGAVRAAVAFIAANDLARGALVTTHKIGVFRHAGDLFGAFDSYACALGEVSSIARRDGRLVGHAKDPITSGLALDRIVGRDHWRAHPEARALLMGAGGACVALAAHLLERPRGGRPAGVALTDIDPERLADARRHLEALDRDGLVSYRGVAGAEDHDALLAALPVASLVVNGTGLGKDRPGSPITDAAVFPEGGTAWEFNYRGELGFLHRARRQTEARRLRVADGWVYFLYGWAHVIAEVFDRPLDDALFARLERAAERLR
ncbi:MAG TPA: hypothetical protein VFG47_00370 [Geminicoccaceae bacterium]|nr:hypothetical protein [Geminicoccaceae bacterium]